MGPVDAARFDGFQKALVSELEETVRQHAVSEGFSFVGPVRVEVFIDDDIKPGNLEVKTEFIGGESQPRLILSDGRSFNVGEQPLVIGRSPDVEVVINDSNVSRRHAEVLAHERRRGDTRPPIDQRDLRERSPGHRGVTVTP